jgi:hypothetical protein
MKTVRHTVVAIASIALAASTAYCDETATEKPKPTQLRLFNTGIFGKRTTDAVVLLEPQHPGELDPETVMVDISKGQYFAATVNYPTTISFEDARKSLNRVYKKWESESFAADPDMGIWRNDDDKFSVQLTQNGFSITVIYLKFSMLTDEKLDESFRRVGKIMEDEENAKRAVSLIHGLLKKSDYVALYRDHCSHHLQRQIGEREFVELMQGDEGKKVAKLFASVAAAIDAGKGRETLAARFGERDGDEYEFVLVAAQRQRGANLLWHLQLEKENGAWKLMDYD